MRSLDDISLDDMSLDDRYVTRLASGRGRQRPTCKGRHRRLARHLPDSDPINPPTKNQQGGSGKELVGKIEKWKTSTSPSSTSWSLFSPLPTPSIWCDGRRPRCFSLCSPPSQGDRPLPRSSPADMACTRCSFGTGILVSPLSEVPPCISRLSVHISPSDAIGMRD